MLNAPIRRIHLLAKNTVLVAALASTTASAALAQVDSAAEKIGGSYYGPRIGVTYLAPSVVEKAKAHSLDTGPVIMQFGWQWEQRFVISSQAPVLASGLVFLVGGAEQGVLLPSLSWLIGVRGTGGGEFGIGPVVSLTGANLAIAAGVTKKYGEVYVPWNVVLVTGKPGVRVSLLTGFNMNRRRLNQ